MKRLVTFFGMVLVLSLAASGQVILYQSSTASASTSTTAVGPILWPAPATGFGPGGAVGGWDQGPIVLPPEPPGGYYQVGIDDCCLVGDIYEPTLGSAPGGWTSVVPLGGPTLSSGTFRFPTATFPGGASLQVTDLLLSYIGSPDPWGGGVVPPEYSPAGFSILVTYNTPEPNTLMLLGTGVLGLAGLARRKFRL